MTYYTRFTFGWGTAHRKMFWTSYGMRCPLCVRPLYRSAGQLSKAWLGISCSSRSSVSNHDPGDDPASKRETNVQNQTRCNGLLPCLRPRHSLIASPSFWRVITTQKMKRVSASVRLSPRARFLKMRRMKFISTRQASQWMTSLRISEMCFTFLPWVAFSSHQH